MNTLSILVMATVIYLFGGLVDKTGPSNSQKWDGQENRPDNKRS